MLPIIVHELVFGVRRWHDRRVATRELEALNDHFLRDIGIERHQIRQTVAQAQGAEPGRRRKRKAGRAADAAAPELPGWPAGARY